MLGDPHESFYVPESVRRLRMPPRDVNQNDQTEVY